MLKNIGVGKIVLNGCLGYVCATYFSYKYNQFTKAQLDLKAIPNKMLFLNETHNKIAETYDKVFARREFSNKLSRYRNVLLSYAEGDVLETGVGTGITFRFFNGKQITSYTGVDWSSIMLEKAFETKVELAKKDEFPFENKQQFKLM